MDQMKQFNKVEAGGGKVACVPSCQMIKQPLWVHIMDIHSNPDTAHMCPPQAGNSRRVRRNEVCIQPFCMCCTILCCCSASVNNLLRQLMQCYFHSLVCPFPAYHSLWLSFCLLDGATHTASDGAAAEAQVCSLIADERSAKAVLMHVKAHFKDKVCCCTQLQCVLWCSSHIHLGSCVHDFVLLWCCQRMTPTILIATGTSSVAHPFAVGCMCSAAQLLQCRAVVKVLHGSHCFHGT